VRALQKAGFGSLKALRTARLEDLLAVPGMTVVKANHIVDYLAITPDAPPDPDIDEADDHDHSDKEDSPELEAALSRLLARLAHLMLHSPAIGYRPRLLREIEQFLFRASHFTVSARDLTAKARSRAAKRLNRIDKDISRMGIPEALGRKEQAQIADTLEDIANRLNMPAAAALHEEAAHHA
jgi:hypothetical protein